ncbi:MAG: hypothetical protein ACOYO9_06785 [Candidatus Nanopelagicales bacterium]|jgi:hypothetical protein
MNGRSTLGAPVRIDVGQLTATFADGDLFDVRWGGIEVVQRLYLAVRDEAWNTIPASFSNVVITQTDELANIGFDALHEHGSIRYQWHGSVTASADGELSYEMQGRALQEFRYCKIGFNVHHGLRSHAGRSFRLSAQDGVHKGTFRADVAPQLIRDGTLTAMTQHFDRLDIDLDGADVSYRFDGDRFEMQDHRNWIDANWKTYGTPLEQGFPMDIHEGDQLYQRVTMTVAGAGASHPQDGTVELVRDSSPTIHLPRIGHLLTVAPDDAQVACLRGLRPDHIRVDLHPGVDLAGRLAEAETVAKALDAGLEVGAFLRVERAVEDADTLAGVLAHCATRIDRILVLAEVTGFSAFRGACPPGVSEHVRTALADVGVEVPSIVSGTSQFFVDINRDRPDYSKTDGIVFAVNPQVHASDDRSVMQNPEAIPDVVHFARQLYGAIDVVMSPVDLIGLNGPFPAGPSLEGEGPANEDPRQQTSFCAAWTLAALAHMVRAGTTSVTLFELVGARGLVVDPERMFPVADLLACLARTRSSRLISVRSSDPDRVAVLAFHRDDADVFLIGNLTQDPIAVRPPSADEVTVPGYGVVLWSKLATDRIA